MSLHFGRRYHDVPADFADCNQDRLLDWIFANVQEAIEYVEYGINLGPCRLADEMVETYQLHQSSTGKENRQHTRRQMS